MKRMMTVLVDVLCRREAGMTGLGAVNTDLHHSVLFHAPPLPSSTPFNISQA